MNEGDEKVYFFDTSALLKRYHSEMGTEVIDVAFHKEDIKKVISDISVIEAYSAFAKKIRTGEISKKEFRDALKEVSEDIRKGTIQVAALNDDDKKEAARIIEKYGLTRNIRTLDAMQLAVMKKISSSSNVQVYCADQPFVKIIEAEGLTVINPEETK